MREGWYRIWLIATVVITSFSLLIGLTSNDIVRETGEVTSCFPGTEDVYSDTIRQLVREPTTQELDAAVARMARNGEIIDRASVLAAQEALRTYEERELRVTNCASYGAALRSLLVGLLISLFPFLIAAMLVWVWRGFKKAA